MTLIDEMQRTRTIEAQINYLAPMDGRPQTFAGDYARNVMDYDSHIVTIYDGSVPPIETDIDREGFVMLHHKSAVTDFADPDQYEGIYKPEIGRLLQEMTGADYVALNGNGVIRRSGRMGKIDRDDTTMPVPFPHIDASDVGIHQLMDGSGMKRPAKVKRWAFYNTWRLLTDGPVDEPLAICDAQTLDRADLVVGDSHFPPNDQGFESLKILYNPAHRWTYFSKMGRDNLLVFKTNDSDPDRAHFVPHTAIHDTSLAGIKPRVSIEVRAYLAWL